MANIGVAQPALLAPQTRAEIGRQPHRAELLGDHDLRHKRERRFSEERLGRRVGRQCQRRQHGEVDERRFGTQQLQFGTKAQVAKASRRQRRRRDVADTSDRQRPAGLKHHHRQVDRQLRPIKQANRRDQVAADPMGDEGLAAHAHAVLKRVDHHRVQRVVEEQPGIDVQMARRVGDLGVDHAIAVHRRAKRIRRHLRRSCRHRRRRRRRRQRRRHQPGARTRRTATTDQQRHDAEHRGQRRRAAAAALRAADRSTTRQHQLVANGVAVVVGVQGIDDAVAIAVVGDVAVGAVFAAIAVGVGIGGIGADLVDLLTVGQTVVVGVGVVGIGTDRCFLFIAQAVAVGVAVGASRVGRALVTRIAEAVDLGAVADAVIVAVGVIGVGAGVLLGLVAQAVVVGIALGFIGGRVAGIDRVGVAIAFREVAETVAVAVGVVRVGAEVAFFAVVEAVAVGVTHIHGVGGDTRVGVVGVFAVGAAVAIAVTSVAGQHTRIGVARVARVALGAVDDAVVVDVLTAREKTRTVAAVTQAVAVAVRVPGVGQRCTSNGITIDVDPALGAVLQPVVVRVVVGRVGVFQPLFGVGQAVAVLIAAVGVRIGVAGVGRVAVALVEGAVAVEVFAGLACASHGVAAVAQAVAVAVGVGRVAAEVAFVGVGQAVAVAVAQRRVEVVVTCRGPHLDDADVDLIGGLVLGHDGVEAVGAAGGVVGRHAIGESAKGLVAAALRVGIAEGHGVRRRLPWRRGRHLGDVVLVPLKHSAIGVTQQDRHTGGAGERHDGVVVVGLSVVGAGVGVGRDVDGSKRQVAGATRHRRVDLEVADGRRVAGDVGGDDGVEAVAHIHVVVGRGAVGEVAKGLVTGRGDIGILQRHGVGRRVTWRRPHRLDHIVLVGVEQRAIGTLQGDGQAGRARKDHDGKVVVGQAIIGAGVGWRRDVEGAGNERRGQGDGPFRGRFVAGGVGDAGRNEFARLKGGDVGRRHRDRPRIIGDRGLVLDPVDGDRHGPTILDASGRARHRHARLGLSPVDDVVTGDAADGQVWCLGVDGVVV